MPLRDDLLNPVPGDNPSGVSLRYERIYDQIKEARTEDDESIPSGEWQRTVKKADFALVIKLAGEALATKSKDLQLAAWLTEAHVKREGISLIQPCFKLMQDLQELFWEGLYPEIEDGDVGMRAVPIEWAANRIATILRESPITRDGLNYYQYKDSRTIGYEADVGYNDAKREAREQAIKDGKPTAEDFDKAVASTPKTFYVNLDESMHSAAETVNVMQVFCEEKYGDDGPGFGKLRTALEEVGQVIGSLLNEKRKLDPDQVVEEESEPEAQSVAEVETVTEAAPAAKVTKGKAVSAEPADWDDAISRIQVCAQFLQKDRPSSPVAYLLQASVRLGEMREQGSYASYDFLVSPPTEMRQNLKRLASESNWEEWLNAAVVAAGEPCGRAWLDVHRYVWRASYEAGHSAISASVIATLQSLLKDIPELPTWTLNDDTPTANPETQRWLEEMVIPKSSEPIVQEAAAPSEPQPVYVPAHDTSDEPGEDAPPDVLDIAKDMIRRGQLPQAIQLLVRDAAQQPSGRARFLRRLQVAQLCFSAGQSKVAHPVLEELVKEIDQRRLEEWEASDMITPPLALLLKCLDPSSSNGVREALFAKLCRIDPSFAMDVSH